MSFALPSRRAVLLSPPFARNRLWLRARAVPSLDLRFADNKSLSDSVTGQQLVTFTRASTATYFDASGVMQTAANNEARFDHDPVTGASLGLLIEEARTNSLTYSEQFENIAWTASEYISTVTANTNTAPNGTATADTINCANASSYRYQQVLGVSAGTAYTFSVWLASGTKTQIGIRITGTATGTGGHLIVNLTPTLTRYSLTVTIPSGNTAAFVGFDNRVSVVGGDGSTGTIIAWGAQFERGSIPTSYIPTVASTVTRAAEVATLTGTNFSSWFNASEGTVYTVGRGPAVLAGAQPNLWVIDDTPSTNFMIGRVTGTGTTATFFVSVSGSLVATIVSPTFPLRSTFAQASSYALNDFASVVNGGTVGTDTLGAVPIAVNKASLGSGKSFWLNGTIARFTYYPTRLSNAALQALTAP